MHVLHLETGTRLYGGPRQVLELLRALRGTGVDSTLVSPTGSAIAAAAVADGVATVTHDIGGDLDVAALVWFTQWVRRAKPDLIHAHSRRGADFFGGLAASVADVPAVLTRRVDSTDTPFIGTLKYRPYDRVVAISESVRTQLVNEGVPAAKVSVIRSAVDVAACQPTWSREQFLKTFDLEPNQRIVAVAAQLIPRKGYALLVEAWPLVRNRCPDARLVVFGTGPLEAELRAMAGLGGTVTFAGFRPDLRDYLGHADLVVHAALREGLGVTLLEAQAAGVPIAAFAAGGVVEAVQDGVTGVLVPTGNHAALAEAIITLLEDPNLRQRMGAAARERIAREFSPAAMANAYADLYRSVRDARR